MNPHDITRIIEQSPKMLADGAAFACSKNLIIMLLRTGAGHAVYAIEPHTAKEMLQVFHTMITMYESQNGPINVNKPVPFPVEFTKPPQRGEDDLHFPKI